MLWFYSFTKFRFFEFLHIHENLCILSFQINCTKCYRFDSNNFKVCLCSQLSIHLNEDWKLNFNTFTQEIQHICNDYTWEKTVATVRKFFQNNRKNRKFDVQIANIRHLKRIISVRNFLTEIFTSIVVWFFLTHEIFVKLCFRRKKYESSKILRNKKIADQKTH